MGAVNEVNEGKPPYQEKLSWASKKRTSKRFELTGWCSWCDQVNMVGATSSSRSPVWQSMLILCHGSRGARPTLRRVRSSYSYFVESDRIANSPVREEMTQDHVSSSDPGCHHFSLAYTIMVAKTCRVCSILLVSQCFAVIYTTDVLWRDCGINA